MTQQHPPLGESGSALTVAGADALSSSTTASLATAVLLIPWGATSRASLAWCRARAVSLAAESTSRARAASLRPRPPRHAACKRVAALSRCLSSSVATPSKARRAAVDAGSSAQERGDVRRCSVVMVLSSIPLGVCPLGVVRSELALSAASGDRPIASAPRAAAPEGVPPPRARSRSPSRAPSRLNTQQPDERTKERTSSPTKDWNSARERFRVGSCLG